MYLSLKCKIYIDIFVDRNWMLDFGLVFETVLAAILCYTPFLDKGLNMYPLK